MTTPHITTDDTDGANPIRVFWDDGTDTGYPTIRAACRAMIARGADDWTVGTDISSMAVDRAMTLEADA